MRDLNYKHLHYFWVVAKAGGVARASERLHLTPQAISGQLRMLEDALGSALFRRVGRNLELTDTGRVVLGYAEEIFALGEELQDAMQHGPAGLTQEFRVGIGDMVAKSVVYRLLEPALRLPQPQRIICREGRLVDLLGELAIHRLDLVIADRPMPSNVNIRGFNHLLGECGITFFAAPALAANCKGPFPHNLDGTPLLLPGPDSAVRPRLVSWLQHKKIRPRIVGEFDDGALLKAFGQAGTGVFAAPSVLAGEVARQYGVVPLGETGEVTEQFYAISVERRLSHPAVVSVSSAARNELFVGAHKPRGKVRAPRSPDEGESQS